LKIEPERIESKIGTYIVGKENSLPIEFTTIGNKLDFYRKEIAQKFFFRTEEQINEIIGETFYASIKRDGIFAGFYFNNKTKNKTQSFFFNSPTHRVYLNLPIAKELERYLISMNVEECLLIGELLATSKTPLDFNRRCRVYDFTFYSRNPNKFEDLKRIGFIITDIIILDSDYLIKNPFSERIKILNKLLSKFNSDVKGRIKIVTSKTLKKEELKGYFRKTIEDWEGLIVRTDSIGYKLKPVHTIDVVIIGFAVGRIDSKIRKDQVSSVLTALRYDDGSYQLLTKVGSGLTDDLRSKLYNELKNYIVKSSNFYPTTSDGRAFNLVNPRVVSEIKYMDLIIDRRGELIKQHCLNFNETKKQWKLLKMEVFPKLYAPRFSKTPIREDKSPSRIKDVRISQITDLIDKTPPKIIKEDVLEKSEIIFETFYTNKDRIIKFVGFKTNKEKHNFPPYVIYYCNYNPNRKDPVERKLRISTTFQKFKKGFESFITEKMLSEKTGNIKRGWVINKSSINETLIGKLMEENNKKQKEVEIPIDQESVDIDEEIHDQEIQMILRFKPREKPLLNYLKKMDFESDAEKIEIRLMPFNWDSIYGKLKLLKRGEKDEPFLNAYQNEDGRNIIPIKQHAYETSYLDVEGSVHKKKALIEVDLDENTLPKYASTKIINLNELDSLSINDFYLYDISSTYIIVSDEDMKLKKIGNVLNNFYDQEKELFCFQFVFSGETTTQKKAILIPYQKEIVVFVGKRGNIAWEGKTKIESLLEIETIEEIEEILFSEYW
jgi:hypothetical protein